MHHDGINPYQPVILESPQNDDIACEVSFRVTYALLHHGESQYLLHWHPRRLFFGSLLMIAASCAVFLVSIPLGGLAFIVGLFGSMIASALIYLALVRNSKTEIRKNLRDHGLINGATCTVVLDEGQWLLKTLEHEYQWSMERTKVYRTGKGILLCPEPLLFVFIPKHNDSSREAFDLLRKRLT